MQTTTDPHNFKILYDGSVKNLMIIGDKKAMINAGEVGLEKKQISVVKMNKTTLQFLPNLR